MGTNHDNQPTTPTNQQWVRHINSLIEKTISGVPFTGSFDEKQLFVDSFTDEYGNRRATDRPFLCSLLGITLEPPEITSALDQQLWWVIQSGVFDAETVSEFVEPCDALVRGSNDLAIEYRTMVELCALHALWKISTITESTQLRERCLNAASWHTRELQPDNAINRPWATQVFIALSHEDPDQEVRHLAHLHAQTLIHNTSVSFGSPDILSALVLKDVADELTAQPAG